MTNKSREERGDGLTFKIDEERGDGWSAKTAEERADGSGPTEKWLNRCSWTVTGSESGGCNLAQVTPSTELKECAIPKWEDLMTWVELVASNGGDFDGVDGGLGGVEWWR